LAKAIPPMKSIEFHRKMLSNQTKMFIIVDFCSIMDSILLDVLDLKPEAGCLSVVLDFDIELK
jgi:hypothetical protein